MQLHAGDPTKNILFNCGYTYLIKISYYNHAHLVYSE